MRARVFGLLCSLCFLLGLCLTPVWAQEEGEGAPPAEPPAEPPAAPAGEGEGEAEAEEDPITNVDAEEGGMQPEDHRFIQQRRDKRDEVAQKIKEQHAIKESKIQEQNQIRAEKIDKMSSADTVTLNDQSVNVPEPKSSEQALGLKKPVRDPYEISGEDFDLYKHERWSLNRTDFRFDKPVYVVDNVRAGHTRRWFCFPFSITNSTTQKRRIAPVFVAVTDKGVFMPEAGGYLPQRILANTTFHPLADGNALQDRAWANDGVIPMESVQSMVTRQLQEGQFVPDSNDTFLPGQTRWGAAIWPAFVDEWTELKIVVHGLSNAHRYDRKMRRALVLSFSRNDDEFHVARSNIHYLDKQWEFLWMWDQDISVPVPENAAEHKLQFKTITTPAGGERLMATFPFVVANSTPEPQAIVTKEARLILRGAKSGENAYGGFDVDVGGAKVTVPEIHLVDDGRSTIYKAQFARELGKTRLPAETNRFVPSVDESRKPGYKAVYKLEGRKVSPDGKIEAAKLAENDVIVDATEDVDWEHVRLWVEDLLTAGQDKKELAAKAMGDRKPPEGVVLPVYHPRRRLTDDVLKLKDGRVFEGAVTRDDESGVNFTTLTGARLRFGKDEVENVQKGEFSSVKEQILAAIPKAIETLQSEKKVIAQFTCESGLASGSYRIMRSYHKPGVIQDEWLSAWEALDKE